MIKKFLIVLGVLLVIAFIAGQVAAVAVPKVTWCHVEPNGNQQTLELPQAALENAGHVNAAGNPLHAGDHAGACVEPTVTPTVEPTVTPEVTPEVTPTVTPEVTATPSATPTQPFQGGGGGDGRSDGRSDGLSSCPSCTQAPKVVVPAGAPATGRG